MMRGSNIGIMHYDLSYYGHLGASCSSGIAISTLLIGAMLKLIWSPGGFLFKHRSYSHQREHSCRYPLWSATPTPLGAIWSYSNLSLTPLERFTDRIRIRSLKIFICFSYSFCNHKYLSCHKYHVCRLLQNWVLTLTVRVTWTGGIIERIIRIL